MVVKMGKEYLDSSLKPEIRAKALLKEMSLEEKVAQLTGVFPFDEEYKNYDVIAESTRYGIGEVSTLEMRRMAEESAGNRDEKQRAPYPCYFSYGGTVRSFHSGLYQLPSRNRQGCRI